VRDAEDELASLGAGIAAIGSGDLRYAEDFRRSYRLDFPLLVDEDLVSYRQVGAGRATTRQMVSASTVRSGARAVLRGNMQGRTGRHPMVLGATHIIRPEGFPGPQVIFAWVNADFGDNAPVAAILAALRRGVE
jgi:hypothetical protein